MAGECKDTRIFLWGQCRGEFGCRQGSVTTLLTKNSAQKMVELSVIWVGEEKRGEKTPLDWFWYFWDSSDYMLLLLTLMKYSETVIDLAAWLFFQGRSISLQLVSIFIPVSGAFCSLAISFNYRSLYVNWLIWVSVIQAVSKVLFPF